MRKTRAVIVVIQEEVDISGEVIASNESRLTIFNVKSIEIITPPIETDGPGPWRNLLEGNDVTFKIEGHRHE